MLEAQEFLRALRGGRSQVAFSRRIGFRSNVAAQWEAGRRMPTVVDALRAAQKLGVDVPTAFQKFHRGSALAVGIEAGLPPSGITTDLLAAWLREQKGARTITEVAENCDLSRTQISRALSGAVLPRLPEFFTLIQVLTRRLPEFIGCFVDIEAVPSALKAFQQSTAAQALIRENPWTAAVVTLLDTTEYKSTQLSEVEFLELRLPLERALLKTAVDQLTTAGVLRRSGTKLVLDQPLTLDLAGSEAKRLRAHWAQVAAERLHQPEEHDLFSYNLVSLSTADYERIRALQKDFFRQVRSIVAESQPSECAALLSWHLIRWSAREGFGEASEDEESVLSHK